MFEEYPNTVHVFTMTILGIGYYTLPYLVHTGASYVHACEWNPDAVEALKHNLEQNHVEKRCTVYAGDNKNVGI